MNKLYSAIDNQWYDKVDRFAGCKQRIEEPFISKRNMAYGTNRLFQTRGEVGYGAFYSDRYKSDFETGAAIEHLIICPDTAGGDLSGYLYLTSTNRTTKGVEAFISYYGQEKCMFKVFDWARTEQWQLVIEYEELKKYFVIVPVLGANYQALHVMNLTYESSTGQWINDVCLKDPQSGELVVVYRYEYACSAEEQKNPAVYTGSWGPIIETFQKRHNQLNPVGFINTYVAGRDRNGNWEHWKRLDADISSMRDDGVGLSLLHLEPNHSFICN